MKRLFFITSSLYTVERAEKELVRVGINEDALHLLSQDITEAEARNLHPVSGLDHTNIYIWLEQGVLVGILTAAFILSLAFFSGWTADYTWYPFVLAALISIGISVWEAGFSSVDKKNSQYEIFDDNIQNGEHVLFVDCDDSQAETIKYVCLDHHDMTFAGADESFLMSFAGLHKQG